MTHDKALSAKQSELEYIRKEIEVELRQGFLPDLSNRRRRNERRLVLEREIAAATGDEYAEPLALDVVVGDEWHLIAGFFSSVVLLCGDVDAQGSNLFEFSHTQEIRFGGLNDEVFDSHPLNGKGLDAYGLFVVKNSRWKDQLHNAMLVHPSYSEVWWSKIKHYILRGKGGELSCLSRGYERRALQKNILELRSRVMFWKSICDESTG
jgi:hypothetical protein